MIEELDFAALFSPAAWIALAPLIAVSAGMLLLLVAEVIDALRPLRTFIFLGSLAAAGACEARILAGSPELEAARGIVLDGTLSADSTSALWGLVFLAATALAFAFGHGFYRGGEARHKAEHDLLMLCAPLGMMIMAGAQDLVLFFLGLELLSIPLYVLAAFQRDRAASVEAGIKYFLLGAFGSALFVYGAALLYADTGSLSLVVLRGSFDAEAASTLAQAGVALLVASLFFKLSVFPFHLWVPDVYQGSPTPVTALMAAGTKGAAIAFLLNASFLMPSGAARLVGAIALVTVGVGYLGALVQDDLKRMLAYSGVASAGTILLVVAGVLAAPAELEGAARTAALYYMGAYAFAIVGAFGLVGMLEREDERFTRLASLAGLARTRPGLAAALSLFVLSLGGIPATGGFLGKWFVFAVLVRADMVGFAVVAGLFSVIALAFYLRIIVTMWMQPSAEGAAASSARPLFGSVAIALCVAGVLATGLLPQLFLPG